MKRKILLPLGVLALATATIYAATSRAGYETAPYTPSEKDGDFELRTYPELTVAVAAEGGNRDGAFMKLFRYIEGANVAAQKIEMTTPVFMDRIGQRTEMSFVMPGAFHQKAPDAKSAEVKVTTRPARKYAVFRYAGWQSAKNEAAAVERLRAWMAERKIQAKGEPTFAYYDPPWTPGPMRRNEVLIPIAK